MKKQIIYFHFNFFIFRIERENLYDLDPNLIDLLTVLLSNQPEERYTIQQIKVRNHNKKIKTKFLES